MPRLHNKRVLVEEEFITDEGFKGIVLLQNTGYRTGYINIPKLQLSLLNENERDNLSNEIYVHGGITYHSGSSNFDYASLVDGHVYGFDCAHAGDAMDVKAVKESGLDFSYIEMMQRLVGLDRGVIRDTEFVKEQIRSMSKQIENYIKDNFQHSYIPPIIEESITEEVTITRTHFQVNLSETEL